MSEYNFSFDNDESREIFNQTIEASKKYEEKCSDLLEGFYSLEKLPMDKIEEYAGKEGIVIYWEGDTLVHIKICADNKALKLAGIETFSYTEVEDIYLTDLLNTINLKFKPKFIIDLKGKDSEVFLHIQKLELVAEGLDIPDEDAFEFCEKMDVSMYVNGSGIAYVNLGEFVEKLMACAK